jgi:hypothetical protein
MPLDLVYSEYERERQMLGVIADVSERGLRLERLFRRAGGPDRRIQLEFQLPGGGEWLWALGEICFDRVRPSPSRGALVRTSGVRVVRAAARHLRMLREFAHDRTLQERPDEEPWFMRASHFR